MKVKILALFLMFILVSCKKEIKNSPNKENIVENPFVAKDGNYCFLEIIDNKIKKGDDYINEANKLMVNLVIEGKKVHGNFDYLPYNEKINRGKFTGLINDNIIKTVCVFNQNGSSKSEEVIFKIETNKISILGGEKEKVDGVWKFIDISKGFYMNEIPKISCE